MQQLEKEKVEALEEMMAKMEYDKQNAELQNEQKLKDELLQQHKEELKRLQEREAQ